MKIGDFNFRIGDNFLSSSLDNDEIYEHTIGSIECSQRGT